MKNKHIVYLEATENLPGGYYTGLSSYITGPWAGGIEYRGPKEEATWLTQNQAKRLIDKCRHVKLPCHAIPSFTVTY